MKKITAILLAAALVFVCLGACGKADDVPQPTPTETARPTSKPTPKPTVEPTAEPTAEPAPPAVQPPAESGSQVDLTAFYDSLSASYELPGMMDADQDALDAFYPGLTGYTLNQRIVKMAAITGSVAEFALIECASETDAAAVAAILQARVTAQVDGGAWYPASIEGWKLAQVVTNGSYVALIALGDSTSSVVDAFNALF